MGRRDADIVRVMKQIRTLAVIVVLSVSAVACGGSTAETVTSEPMPAGENSTVSGSQLDLGSLEGQDTVLWFWAPW